MKNKWFKFTITETEKCDILFLKFTASGKKEYLRRCIADRQNSWFTGMGMCNTETCPFRLITDFSMEDGPIMSGVGLELPINRQFYFLNPLGCPFEDAFDKKEGAEFLSVPDIEGELDDEFDRLLEEEMEEKSWENMEESWSWH